MAHQKRSKPPVAEARRSSDQDQEPAGKPAGDKILVPIFTAVVLLLIAAAVAVVMSPDKETSGTDAATSPGVDARPALPPAGDQQGQQTAPPNQDPLLLLIPAIELELARKDRSLGLWSDGRAPDPRQDPYLRAAPVVGSRAKDLAARIPANGPPYAMALKAICNGDYARARKMLDELIVAQNDNPVLGAREEARLYAVRGDADYFDLRFSAASENYSTAMEIAPDNAYIRYSAARALLRIPPPKEEQRLVLAINLLTELESKHFSLDKTPLDWGLAKLALGVAFWNFSLGDQAVNRDRALDAYEASLQAFNREASPVEWARTHGFLGELYTSRPEGDRADNLAKAMDHYRKAMEIISREDFPRQWSSLQSKLAAAYVDLPSGERQTNLKTAIQCYEEGLEVLDPTSQAASRASIQMALGTAHSNLEEDKLQNLMLANQYFDQALTVLTVDRDPADWAAIQNNMANNHIALASMPDARDRHEHIETAVKGLEGALDVLAPSATPFEWASAQYNLGAAMRMRVAGDRQENLQRAVQCFDQALMVFNADSFPQYHTVVNQLRADTQAELLAQDP